LEYSTTTDAQFSTCQAQPLETRTKYDKLAAQVTKEDPIVRSIVAHGFRRGYDSYYGGSLKYLDHQLQTLSDRLLVFRPHLLPQPSTPAPTSLRHRGETY